MDISVIRADWIVHSDKENAVWESAFDLDLVKLVHYPGQDMATSKQVLAMLHQVCNRVFSISDSLLKHRCDQGGRFGQV